MAGAQKVFDNGFIWLYNEFNAPAGPFNRECRRVTGMHGGVIYSRIPIDSYKLGKEVKQIQAEDDDMEIIDLYAKKFSEYFGFDYRSIMDRPFVKIYPYNHRPYGNLYVY